MFYSCVGNGIVRPILNRLSASLILAMDYPA